MRNGLFLSALLASIFVTGAAMADRADENNSSKYSRGRQIKEQVLEKQREGHAKLVREAANTNVRNNRALDQRVARSRPHGDVYGDQAARSTTKSQVSSAGKSLSATSSVNTPREIKSMLSRINPMYGAYRTSQASEGTDSYGGRTFYGKDNRTGRVKNMSMSGTVNTPKEIQAMLGMFGPGAASQAGGSPGSTDSYGGGEQPTDLNRLKAGIYGSGYNRGQAAKFEQARESRLQERVTKIVKTQTTKGEAPKTNTVERGSR